MGNFIETPNSDFSETKKPLGMICMIKNFDHIHPTYGPAVPNDKDQYEITPQQPLGFIGDASKYMDYSARVTVFRHDGISPYIDQDVYINERHVAKFQFIYDELHSNGFKDDVPFNIDVLMKTGTRRERCGGVFILKYIE